MGEVMVASLITYNTQFKAKSTILRCLFLFKMAKVSLCTAHPNSSCILSTDWKNAWNNVGNTSNTH